MALDNTTGMVIWMIGLSGSGKTTLSSAVKQRLTEPCVLLDGDELRATICSDLGFSEKDREENVRRIANLASLLAKQGFLVIVAAISPTERIRNIAKEIVPNALIVYLRASVSTREKRDVKGLYRRARAGEIPFFYRCKLGLRGTN